MKRLQTVLSRKIIRLLCGGLMLGMLLCPLSGAAQIQVEVRTGEQAGRLEAEGRIDEPRGVVTLMVLPKSLTPEQLSSELLNREKYIVKTLRADASGGYSTELVMPETMPSGTYMLYVSDGNTQAEAEFSHVNPVQAQTALAAINAAGRDEMFKALEAAEDDLALDPDLLARHGAALGKLLYAGRPERGYTMQGLLEELDRATAIAMIRENRAEEAAAQYAAAFGLVYQEDFAPLSNRVKTVFAEEIRNAGLDRPAMALFMESLIYARVAATPSYMEAQEALLRYRDYLNWDFSGYERLSVYEKSQVFSKLVASGIQSFSNIRPAFDRIVRELNSGKKENAGTGGRPPGGGSGGGSGGYSDQFQVEQVPAEPQPSEKPSSVFSDLEGHWSQSVVEKLAVRGIVSGYEDGGFHPDQPVTRAEFSKLAGTALKLAPGGGQAFADVAPEDWYYPYVYGAQSAGLIFGYDGRFAPMEQITREDSAVILYRALEQRGRAPQGEFDFQDSPLISEYAREAVEALAAQGLLRGFEGNFNPDGSTTRAEAASMIESMLRFLGEV